MKIITDIEQGTKEWHELRRCKVTGTKLDAVMGTELARLQLIAELIAEEGTEQSKVLKPTVEMERGTAEEIFAIKRFEEKFGKEVEKVTICISDEFDWLAISPDGLIADKKGKYTEAVEIKNPDSKTVIFYRMMNNLNGEIKLPAGKMPFCGVPLEYKWQIVASFIVNKDLEKMNFIVHDARFIDESAKLDLVVIERDNLQLQEAIIEALEALPRFRTDWMNWKEIVLPTWF